MFSEVVVLPDFCVDESSLVVTFADDSDRLNVEHSNGVHVSVYVNTKTVYVTVIFNSLCTFYYFDLYNYTCIISQIGYLLLFVLTLLSQGYFQNVGFYLGRGGLAQQCPSVQKG